MAGKLMIGDDTKQDETEVMWRFRKETKYEVASEVCGTAETGCGKRGTARWNEEIWWIRKRKI